MYTGSFFFDVWPVNGSYMYTGYSLVISLWNTFNSYLSTECRSKDGRHLAFCVRGRGDKVCEKSYKMWSNFHDLQAFLRACLSRKKMDLVCWAYGWQTFPLDKLEGFLAHLNLV